MKKLLPLIVALLLILSLFGCSKPSQGTTGGTTTGGTGDVATPAPDDDTGEEETAVSKWTEDVTVSFCHLDVDSSYDYNDPNDAVRMEVYNRFHIVWDIIPSTWSEWDEKLRVWINAGDMPTFSFWNYNLADYRSYVEQGLLGEFPEGWEENYPNVKQALEATVMHYPVAELVGGHFALEHAILFNLPMSPYVTQWAMWIRKDWVEKAGYENKYGWSWTELVTMMKDMMGRYDELGLVKGTDYMFAANSNDTWWGLGWGEHFKVGITWDEDSQQYVWGVDRDFDKIIGVLNLYKDGADSGWLHPDYYSFTADRENRKLFDSGNLLCVMSEGFSTGRYPAFAETSGLVAEDCIMPIVMLDDQGRHNADEQLNYWASLIFSPSIEDDLFNRILDLCNWKLGDEGKKTVYLGIEGTDWTEDADGTITITREIDPETGTFISISKKYPQCAIFGSFAICGDDFASWNPALDARWLAEYAEDWKVKEEGANQKGGLYPYDWEYWFYSSPIKDKYNVNFADYAAQWVSSGVDFTTALTQFQADNRSLVDEVLAELNANVTPQKVG